MLGARNFYIEDITNTDYINIHSMCNGNGYHLGPYDTVAVDPYPCVFICCFVCVLCSIGSVSFL